MTLVLPSPFQNRRDLPRDIPLGRIEVLRYATKGVKVRMGIMRTKTEITLEQTQQGVSSEVLVNPDGEAVGSDKSKIDRHMSYSNELCYKTLWSQ
ncbi:hypothetical protein Tco_0582758 [Tanacetum coccineum]